MRTHSSKLRLRRALLIGVLALCGAAAAVLLAWTCAAIRAFLEDASSAAGSRGGTTDTFVSNGPLEYRRDLIRLRTRWPGSEEWFQLYFDPLTVYPIDWPDARVEVPSWVPTPDPKSGNGGGAVACGVPLLCMKSRIDGNTPVTSLRWTRGKSHKSVYLPVVPILPGLLLNTLFYAFLFSTPWTLRAHRRHLRLRRGHCPSCNYDLRHNYNSPCPECGKTAIHTAPACAS